MEVLILEECFIVPFFLRFTKKLVILFLKSKIKKI
jgi:hypothetical protein